MRCKGSVIEQSDGSLEYRHNHYNALRLYIYTPRLYTTSAFLALGLRSLPSSLLASE